jgi:hypothetical protein
MDAMAEYPQETVCVGQEGDDHAVLPVGAIVEVMRRMWPGINKLGGVARIVKSHYNQG